MSTTSRIVRTLAATVCTAMVVTVSSQSAGAAVLTNVKVTPANPTANLATTTTYDIDFAGVTATAAKCIVVRFDASSGGASAGLPSGMTVASSQLTGSTAVTAANWGTGTASANKITYKFLTGENVVAGKLTITGITHNPTTAGTYFAFVDTYSDDTCATAIDSAAAAYAITDNVGVSGTVAATLSFTAAGLNSGTCNGATITATSSTATAMPLGSLSMASNSVAGQTLTVSTNAAGGYTVYLRGTGQMGNGNGQFLAATSGSNATPAAFSAAGTEAFGYTTDHALSGTATRFQPNKWAALNTANEEVAFASAGPVSSDATKLCVQAGISGSTRAGVYTTQLIYSVVPTF